MINFVAGNKKAKFDYEILEKFQAGLVLTGSEVKALRASRANLKDSYCRVIKGEIFMLNAHISHLEHTNPHFKPDEKRPRKLLLHKKEIDKISKKAAEDSLTIVPLGIYFNERNLAKVTIALAKGKKLHDKRETIKKREQDREAKAAIKKHI
ncbi:MAG: SsrA-binding protein SmpB [Campylobacterales bacterium]